MNKKVHSDGCDEFHSAAAKLKCIRNKLSVIFHSTLRVHQPDEEN